MTSPSPQLPESYKSLTYTLPSTPPHITHAPLPSPGPTSLLIKIHAASINPVDIQLWGNPVIGLLAGRKEKAIGLDYAGVVVAVGSRLAEKKKWEVGDGVFGLVSRPTGEEGTCAEYVVVDVLDGGGGDPIARKPRAWSWEEAAGAPLVVLTAFACLDWLPPLAGEGDERRRRVVVNGASGGVGMWCVQLAKKLFNCDVTAICSARNTSFVESLGADSTIDYTSQDVPVTLLSSLPKDTTAEKYDLFIDCVGGTHIFPHMQALLHKNAAYVTIVGDKTARNAMGGPLTYFTYPSQVWRFLKGWVFGPRYANVVFYQKSELLEWVAEMAEKRQARSVVQEVVEGILEEERSAEAWERVKGLMVEGRVRGKVVVRIV